MSSVHKQKGRPHYFAALAVYNPDTGKRRQVFWSTGTSNKRQAQHIANVWEKAAKKARKAPRKSRSLSPSAEKRVIAKGVRDILRAAGLE